MALSILDRLATPTYTLMRVAFGLLFWFHGGQKLFGWFGGTMVGFTGRLGLAGFIEFFGGLLVAMGLATRLAALICTLEMAAAYLTVHAPQGTLPIQNQGELALLYLFVFLYIAARGGGLWSLDMYIKAPKHPSDNV